MNLSHAWNVVDLSAQNIQFLETKKTWGKTYEKVDTPIGVVPKNNLLKLIYQSQVDNQIALEKAQNIQLAP